MATNLAAIIAGSRRNYGVDKYNPDPEARRLALQRALVAQQYQTAMSAPAGPYSGVKKAFAGFQLGRQNREEQRRNALREAARRAYLSQMLGGGTAAASGGAPGGASALMPMEKSFPAMEGGPQPRPGQLAQAGQPFVPESAADRARAVSGFGMTSDQRAGGIPDFPWYDARGGNVPGDSSLGATDSAQGPPLEDAPTVAEAAREASYDIPPQGMMEWADIEGTSLSGAPLDDTVVTEETEVSGPGDLTIRETGAAEVEDDDDRHLLSQFGDFLLGGRELTPELAAKRVAEMSPAELQKAAGFAPGQMALMEAIRSGDPRQMQLALAIMNPQDLAKHLLTKPKEPSLKGPILVTDPNGVQRQRWLTATQIQRIQGMEGWKLEEVARPPSVQVVGSPGETAFAKESAKDAVTRIGTLRSQIRENQKVVARLDTMEALLADGMNSGPVQKILLPIRRLLADPGIGLLPDDEKADLTNQEIFNAAANYIIPRMRVVGSGASSDFEQRLFASATAQLGTSPEANRIIIAGMRALDKHAKEVLRRQSKYAIKHKSMMGFEEEAEKHFAANPIFKKFDNVEGVAKAVKSKRLRVGDLFYDAEDNKFRILGKDHITDLTKAGLLGGKR